MTDSPNPAEARAVPTRKLRISPVWIVPLVAVLVGAWLLFDAYSRRGPLITLRVDSAEGIEAGKTEIRTRSVAIGRVEQVTLSEDLKSVTVSARMNDGVRPLLREDTQLWVVRPRIGRGGISGLDTVLSGAYIQLRPGDSDEEQLEFDVLDERPVIVADAEGVRLTLVSALGSSLVQGDAVSYEGVTVGRVERTEFSADSGRVEHDIFIDAPYDVLVSANTRFWIAPAVAVRLGADGVDVSVQSLEALIGGGLTFGVPDGAPAGAQVMSGAYFELFPDRDAAQEGTFDRYLEYVLLVEGSVRGLKANAPVEYRGLRVGTVMAVPWQLDVAEAMAVDRRNVPILVRFEPRRVEDIGERLTLEQWRDALEQRVGEGLRASLASGNLLTGAMFVNLDFHPGASEHIAAEYKGLPVFPAVSGGGVAELQAKAGALLDKLNSLEIEPVLASLDDALKGTREALAAVEGAASSASGLIAAPATQALPARLDATMRQLRATLRGLSPDSPAYTQLSETLAEVELLMRNAQPLVKTLSERPNALIFSAPGRRDPIPRAAPPQ